MYEHLAANFNQRGRLAMQPRRQRFHGAEVGGDILAFAAVAAGRSADETAVFVGQVDRQSVDLWFGNEIDGRGGPRKRCARAMKSAKSVPSNALSSDSIGTRWCSLANPLSGAAPTRCVGESARISAGNRASIAVLRRRNASYSASEISGASRS